MTNNDIEIQVNKNDIQIGINNTYLAHVELKKLYSSDKILVF